jgi:hypothetical protein
MSPIFGKGNGLIFNKKLSSLKSVTAVIFDTFLLGISNVSESHSEEYYSSSTAIGTLYAHAWTGLQ